MKKISLLCCLLFHAAATFAQDYWKPVVSGTSKDLYCISFGDLATGYIGGADSTLLKTTDGGKTWTHLSSTGLKFNSSYPDIIDLQFINANTGFAVVSNKALPDFIGTAYKTVDGGASWNVVADASMAISRGYYFNENNGYFVGSGFFSGSNVAKYSSGATGAPVYMNGDPSNFIRAIDFLDTATGIIGNSDGHVFRTFDAGAHWDTVKTNIDTAICALRFINDSTIVAATANHVSAIIFSTDRGATWHMDLMSASFYYPAMEGIARSRRDSIVYVGTTAMGEGILYWYGDFLGLQTVPNPLHSVAMCNDSVAYAVGDSGLIVSNARSILAISEPHRPGIAASVFPNPGSGLFTSTMNQPHTVIVYDLNGRVVWQQAKAAVLQEIDLRGQPKGNYIAVLITSSQPQVLYSRITLQ